MNVAILFVLGLVGVALAFSSREAAPAVVDDSVDQPVTSVQADTDPWRRFDELFHSSGDEYGVDWTWLKAFALNESSLGSAPSVARGLDVPTDVEGSKSSDGKSWGLMQVTLKTALTLDSSASPEKLNDPAYSVDLAARYIAQLQKMFSRNDPRFVEWVVKSYNEGPGNVHKEQAGNPGFSDEYWSRWQRNLNKVERNIA